MPPDVSERNFRIGVRLLVYNVQGATGERVSRAARLCDIERQVVNSTGGLDGMVVAESNAGSWKAQKSTTWVPWVLVTVSFWDPDMGMATEERAGIVCVAFRA
jgi:hypothetical protein